MSGLDGYYEARTRNYWRGVFNRARESGVSDRAHSRAVEDMLDSVSPGDGEYYAAQRYRQKAREYARRYP